MGSRVQRSRAGLAGDAQPGRPCGCACVPAQCALRPPAGGLRVRHTPLHRRGPVAGRAAGGLRCRKVTGHCGTGCSALVPLPSNLTTTSALIPLPCYYPPHPQEAYTGLFRRLPGLKLGVTARELQWSDPKADVGLASLPVTW